MPCPPGAKMVCSGNLQHNQTVTSISRTWLRSTTLSTASRYSRTADWIFSIASISVLPWDQQPDRPGHETLVNLLGLFQDALYFMSHVLPELRRR